MVIKTSTANIVPSYGRIVNNELKLSSFAIDCFDAGETVRVERSVFEQMARGKSHPSDNLFSDVKLLYPSAIYSENLEYSGSKINYAESSLVEIDHMVFCEYEKVFSQNEIVIVPLSAGGDSRLNLAMANHFRKKYNNRIIAFHVVQGGQEIGIVKRICDILNIELVVILESLHYNYDKKIYSKKISLFHSGIYRHIIINYSNILDEFKMKYSGCAIIGFGVECHKGLNYKKLDYYDNDCSKVFGYLIPKRIIDIAHSVFEDKYSILDYIYYVVFASNGYGKRCFYFNKKYDIHFPMLNDDFLSAVFSLPRKQKEEASLIKRWIGILNRELLDIQFIPDYSLPFSPCPGNKPQKSKSSLQKNIQQRQQIKMPKFQSRSPVMKELRSILNKDDQIPMLCYALQLFLFFGHAEQEKELKFIFG